MLIYQKIVLDLVTAIQVLCVRHILIVGRLVRPQGSRKTVFDWKSGAKVKIVKNGGRICGGNSFLFKVVVVWGFN